MQQFTITGGRGYYRVDVYHAGRYINGACADTALAVIDWVHTNHPGASFIDNFAEDCDIGGEG